MQCDGRDICSHFTASTVGIAGLLRIEQNSQFALYQAIKVTQAESFYNLGARRGGGRQRRFTCGKETR